MVYTLLLASKSPSRKMLLCESGIPFMCIDQDADETACDASLPLPELVQAIAAYKMTHALLPTGSQDGEYCFVLTADTLSQDKSDGAIQGKPTDRADAVDKIKRARMGSRVCTAFCVNKYVWRDNAWHEVHAYQEIVAVDYLFFIPDNLIDWYLDNSIGLNVAGAVAAEGFGAQFLKTINGSHSGLIGLPLFEVRQALTACGFFEDGL